MNKIVLIACSSKKNSITCPAQEMYEGTLFKKSLELAKLRGYDRIFILSAKYGVVELDQIIEPYNKTLLKMLKPERMEWADMVLNQFKEKGVDIENDEFMFYCGDAYVNPLKQYINHLNRAWHNITIGKLLRKLDEEIRKEKGLI